jgi:hypothetical protein
MGTSTPQNNIYLICGKAKINRIDHDAIICFNTTIITGTKNSVVESTNNVEAKNSFLYAAGKLPRKTPGGHYHTVEKYEQEHTESSAKMECLNLNVMNACLQPSPFVH